MDNPRYTGVANNQALTFVNADGLTLKPLITAGAEGTKVTQISVVNEQLTDQGVELYFNDGSTDFLISTKVVFSSEGTTGDPATLFDQLTHPWLQIDNNGNPFIMLGTGESLKIGMKVAVLAASTVYITGMGADF